MTTPTPPREDLARQVLALAADLDRLTGQVKTLGDPLTLRAQVTGLTRRVAAFTGADSGGIPGLTAAVGGLSDRLAAIEEALADKGPSDLWDFTGLDGSFDGDAREQAWQQLQEWVRDVLGGVYQLTADPGSPATGRATYRDTADKEKVPACWPRHPDLVIELSWLAQEWIRLYRSPYGTPARAGDWHDRYLPGLRRRIPNTTAGPCTRTGQHVTPTATDSDQPSAGGLRGV
jgi:hypothetical protein